VRLLGSSISVLCFALGIFLLLRPPGGVDFPEEVLRGAARQLRASPDAFWPELLSELQSRLPSGIKQVMAVQGIPNEDSLVLAVPLDSSGEEEAAGWRLPFPRLNRILSQNPSQAAIVRENYHRRYYIHYFEPIDELGRYLLVSATARKSTGELFVSILVLLMATGIAVSCILRSRNATKRAQSSQPERLRSRCRR
jgi:hypothetical protein